MFLFVCNWLRFYFYFFLWRWFTQLLINSWFVKNVIFTNLQLVWFDFRCKIIAYRSVWFLFFVFSVWIFTMFLSKKRTVAESDDVSNNTDKLKPVGWFFVQKILDPKYKTIKLKVCLSVCYMTSVLVIRFVFYWFVSLTLCRRIWFCFSIFFCFN